MRKQQQGSGDDSINLQAGGDITYHTGVTAGEVAAIADNLFRDNFLQLATEAAATAEERAQRILTEFLNESQRHKIDLGRARDPDVQYSIFTAQRDYARSGREDLSALLVGLLLKKFQTKPGQLLDIALSEAIETVRKLTQAQVNALTVHWLVSRVIFGHVGSIADLTSEMNKHVGPFIDRVPTGPSDYEHIQYAGCGIVEMGHVDVGTAISHRYPGLFQRGIAVTQIPTYMQATKDFATLFTKSNRLTGGYEVSAATAESAKDLATHLGYSELASEYATLIRIMDSGSIEKELSDRDPIWRRLIPKWNKSPIKSLSLSSVGHVIAHSNWTRVTGTIDADISIWVSDGPFDIEED